MSSLASVMSTWYALAVVAAVVLAICLFHPAVRPGAAAVLALALMFGGFGYWFVAPKFEQLHTACMFFSVAAIVLPFILAANWWWWGVLWKWLGQSKGTNDAV